MFPFRPSAPNQQWSVRPRFGARSQLENEPTNVDQRVNNNNNTTKQVIAEAAPVRCAAPQEPGTPAARKAHVAFWRKKQAERSAQRVSAARAAMLSEPKSIEKTSDESNETVGVGLTAVRQRLERLRRKSELRERRRAEFPLVGGNIANLLHREITDARALEMPMLIRERFERMLLEHEEFAGLSTYWCAFADFERVHGSPETVVALYNMASKCRAEPIEQIEWALEEYENSMKKKKSHQSVTVDNEFVDDDENVDDKVVVDEEMNNSSKIDSSTLDQTSNLITLRYWPTSTMKYIRNCCKALRDVKMTPMIRSRPFVQPVTPAAHGHNENKTPMTRPALAWHLAKLAADQALVDRQSAQKESRQEQTATAAHSKDVQQTPLPVDNDGFAVPAPRAPRRTPRRTKLAAQPLRVPAAKDEEVPFTPASSISAAALANSARRQHHATVIPKGTALHSKAERIPTPRPNSRTMSVTQPSAPVPPSAVASHAGRVLTLATARARPADAAALGSAAVLTPVRRAARLAGRRDSLGVELERAAWAYRPNAQLVGKALRFEEEDDDEVEEEMKEETKEETKEEMKEEEMKEEIKEEMKEEFKEEIKEEMKEEIKEENKLMKEDDCEWKEATEVLGGEEFKTPQKQRSRKEKADAEFVVTPVTPRRSARLAKRQQKKTNQE